jgi:hypothetical protein
MSKYVNIFSEFIKEVAQRLNIPYEQAMKKIETNKALQSEWRERKSQRKELFVPVRTITRASAQQVGMAEELPYQPPPDPLVALQAEYALGEPARQQAQAEYDVAINRQAVRRQRQNDRTALQRGIILGANHAVVDDAGDMWMNMFADEDDDGVAAQPPHYQPIEDIPIARLQAAIRGKLVRTAINQEKEIKRALERVAGDPEETAKIKLLVELDRRVAHLPRRERQNAMNEIVKNQLGKDEQLLLGYNAELERQMEEQARKQARAEQLILNVAKARRAKAEGTARPKTPEKKIDVSAIPAELSKKQRALLAAKQVISQATMPPASTTGVGLSEKDVVDWEDIKWGTFTNQFEAFKRQHPSNTVKDLNDFAKHIVANPKHFKETTKKRARFYLNVLHK